MSLKSIFSRKRKTIIIGVHGLGNKPPRGLLKIWWKYSLLEGLSKIEGAKNRFRFRMAYWADIMYEQPLDPSIKNPDHELHIEEPYISEPIPSPKIRHTLWHSIKLALERGKENLFLNRNGLANYKVLFDLVIKSSFKDLAAYHEHLDSDEKITFAIPVSHQIQQRLKVLLRKYRKHRVLIIAHSMGSLVAYDVLNELADQYNVEVLISMGSPLGLPVLREKIAKDHEWAFDENTLLPTPNNIGKWLNYSDKEDAIAVFDDLSTFFAPNKNNVGPEDHTVQNDYKDWVTNNAHKSFGYLRTPELAQVVADFLGVRKKKFWQRGFLKKKE